MHLHTQVNHAGPLGWWQVLGGQKPSSAAGAGALALRGSASDTTILWSVCLNVCHPKFTVSAILPSGALLRC